MAPEEKVFDGGAGLFRIGVQDSCHSTAGAKELVVYQSIPGIKKLYSG
jgi:hypothetical protein